jgi:hypothetical protein
MTVAEKKNATRWFCRKAFRELGETAGVNVVEIYDAISDLDDWFAAAPTATEATNQAQMIAALPAAFASGSNATQKALLLASVALGRAGAL